VVSEEAYWEKRLVLTADFSGTVLTTSPFDSHVFDFPAMALVGANLADCVDIFADWRERSGESQMQLIILALLYKEQEMPGGFRVGGFGRRVVWRSAVGTEERAWLGCVGQACSLKRLVLPCFGWMGGADRSVG
jgi:hypothetical protein